MSDAEKRLSDVFALHSSKIMENMRVGMPACVVSYDATQSLADVQIKIPQRLQDGTERNLPVITDVPVLWLQAGLALISYPLTAGDYGYVMFSDYDIGAWATELDDGFVQSLRKHAMTDAVFLPQTHNLAQSSLDALEIKYGASTIRLQNDTIAITASSVNVTADTTTVNGNAIVTGDGTVQGNLAVLGNLTVNGTGTVDGISVSGHVHGGVQPGSGTTGAPQ